MGNLYRKLIAPLFLTVSVAIASTESTFLYSENIVEALDRGNFLFKSKDIEEALLEFENVVAMEPTNVKGLTGIMQCHLRLGNLTEARQALDSIRKYSLNAKLLDTLSKHMDEAERLKDQMAARDFFTQQASDFESATDLAPKATIPAPAAKVEQSLDSKSPRGKFAKAIQLQKRGFTAQAIPIFMEAIMEDANLLYANDHKLLEASRSFYLNQVETNPQDVASLFILGWIWEQYMNSAEARKVYERILAATKNDSKEHQIALGKLAFFQEEDKRLITMRAQEEELLRQDADRYRKVQIANGKFSAYSSEDYLKIGVKHIQEKNLPEAIIHLQGALKLQPDNAEAHYHYAVAQMDSAFQGNDNGFAIAKRELETVLSLDPEPALKQKAQDLLNSLSTNTSP